VRGQEVGGMGGGRGGRAGGEGGGEAGGRRGCDGMERRSLTLALVGMKGWRGGWISRLVYTLSDRCLSAMLLFCRVTPIAAFWNIVVSLSSRDSLSVVYACLGLHLGTIEYLRLDKLTCTSKYSRLCDVRDARKKNFRTLSFQPH
jgi:hypothetical protein